MRYEGEASAWRFKREKLEFEPIVGEWTLDLYLKDATGFYEAYWYAR